MNMCIYIYVHIHIHTFCWPHNLIWLFIMSEDMLFVRQPRFINLELLSSPKPQTIIACRRCVASAFTRIL
jgi:hypothetical protein